MQPILHAYDVCQESIEVTGSVKALAAYTSRGLNQAQGHYLIPLSMYSDTTEQIRYVCELGINQNPAQLMVIPDHENGLTSSAMENQREIKRQIKSFGLTHLEPFMHGHRAQELANALGLQTPYPDTQTAHRIVEASNNKSNILTYFSEQNLAVPKGKSVANIQQASDFFNQLINDGFPAAFVKIVRSASGDGTIQVNNETELHNVLSNPRFAEALKDGNIYIDGLIPYTQSPSVLLDIHRNGSFEIIGSNYQMLGKKTPEDIVPTVHLGALGPISQQHFEMMYSHIQATARFLHLNGYVGSANVEGVLYNNKFYAIEINARQTGASTPSKESLAIQRLSQTENFWYCNNNFHVPDNTSHNQVIATLQDLLYNKEKQEGVILSNFAILRKGKCQLTIHAQSRGALDEYIQETTHRIEQLTI